MERSLIGGLLFVILLCASADAALSKFSDEWPWAWVCRSGRGCVKVAKTQPPREGDGSISSLPACKLTCHPESMLWPKPRGSLYLANTLIDFDPNDITVTRISSPSPKVDALMNEAIDVFQSVIRMGDARRNTSQTGGRQSKVNIDIAIVSNEVSLQMTTDESYTLYFNTKFASSDSRSDSTTSVSITAGSFFGARNALESLSQLMAWDESIDRMIMLTAATISDSPAFVHRGLLIDTSRNFVSVPMIKKIIDGMSYNKLNVFHWHLTDTHSFPFVSRREPLLALYGAYSPSQVYTPEDVQDIVHYATVRGVKVVPEFDAPAHVGSGWEWGESHGLGQLALCVNKEPWSQYCVEPPCGQLNPVNDNIYPILENIYKDMSELFDSDIFHMGGDEVKMDCWKETDEIVQWLKNSGRSAGTEEDYLYLWSHFQNLSLERLDKAYNGSQQPVVLWTSGLTEGGHADKFLDKNRYIIQIWTTATDKSIAELYQQGFKLIMSNYDAWYLDCGYGAWVGDGANNWCAPYIGWQKVYMNSPSQLIRNFNLTYDAKQILGGEAALWSEQVDSAGIEHKLWPRSAALAERLWSDPETDWKAAEPRMYHHRQRMVQRGILADALQPEWCHQNDGYCFL